jgi:hypothetical protein
VTLGFDGGCAVVRGRNHDERRRAVRALAGAVGLVGRLAAVTATILAVPWLAAALVIGRIPVRGMLVSGVLVFVVLWRLAHSRAANVAPLTGSGVARV